ncbi:hypothetical protein ORN12_19375 [Pantoea vagans]|uniref:hypothetical protein n=1 Tax=Pantoea vagans TaxID=470934 RepID=UPI00224F9C4B|nr:hypothetical protein [Pantoea vagans]MCX3311122.1 hypothetical protein [Pantoea vagans]
MYKTESETLRDILLGEAIFELLNEKVSITNALLIQKLQELQIIASVASRKIAIRDAILQITKPELQCTAVTGNLPINQVIH